MNEYLAFGAIVAGSVAAGFVVATIYGGALTTIDYAVKRAIHENNRNQDSSLPEFPTFKQFVKNTWNIN